MSDGDISYQMLIDAFTAFGPPTNPIVRYEIDEYGVVNLYSEDGAWRGMTSKAGLQYLLDNAPKDKA